MLQVNGGLDSLDERYLISINSSWVGGGARYLNVTLGIVCVFVGDTETKVSVLIVAVVWFNII